MKRLILIAILISASIVGFGQRANTSTGGGGGSMVWPSGTGIPIVNSSSSWGTTITNNIPISYFNSGTNASSTTFWAGDGTWKTVSAGSMVYPATAGITIASGNQSTWGTSLSTFGLSSIGYFNSGTNASATTFWSGDGTWKNAVTSIGMTVPTGFTISGSPITTSGTLGLSFDTGYSLPSDATQANWTTAFNDKINSISVSGTETKTITLNQQDGTSLSTTFTDMTGGGTSWPGYPSAGIVLTDGSQWLTSVASNTAGQLMRRNLGNTGYEFFTPSYISGNQTITLSGDVTGSGTTAITTVVGDNSHNHSNATITVNIVSSVEGVINDAGDIDLLPSGIVTIAGDDVNNRITIGATEVDGSLTNEIQDLSGSGSTLSGYTLSLSSDATSVTLPNEADGSITNEAQTLTAAGTTSPTITLSAANGAGGGTVTFAGAGGTTLGQSGGTITITSSASGGDGYINAGSYLQSTSVLSLTGTGSAGATVDLGNVAQVGSAFTGSYPIVINSSGNTINPINSVMVDQNSIDITSSYANFKASNGTTDFVLSTNATGNSGMYFAVNNNIVWDTPALGAAFNLYKPTVNTSTFTAPNYILSADDAYAAGWDGSLNVPSKNAVYDKIQSLNFVAGSNTQVQYNNSGAFGASSEFTYDATNKYLRVGATNGTGAMYSGNFILTSDKRLKTNIKSLNRLWWVDAIDFREFSFKADSTNKPRYGVIAQEVEKVNPNLVVTDENGMKGVSYIDLLIAKVARQDEIIQTLLKRIEKLEEK